MQPDGADAGQLWRFTAEQVRFILNWYGIDDAGRFIYRSAVLRRMKGWGKDPVAAALAGCEFVGPCRFGGFNSKGLPTVRALHSSLIRAAAVSQDQLRNLMPLFPAMFPKRLQLEFRMEIGKEIVYANGGRSRIEALTSSARSTEGGRPTFQIRDETQYWLSTNSGHEMAKVIDRDAAKVRGGTSRVLSIQNAHIPGQDSIAERDWDAYEKITSGRTRATGLLYDAVEAPPDTKLEDPESLRHGIELARGDSHWIDVDRIIQEIYDPRTAPSDARRFYLNQIVAAEDAWVSPQEWDSCAFPNKSVKPGEEITMGFDGGESDDHTVLVGCRVSDAHLFTIGIWEPVHGEVDRIAADGAVRRALSTYLVDAFYSDLHPWESYVDKWEADFGEKMFVNANGPRHAIAWDLRTRQHDSTKMAEAFHSAILERGVTHSGDHRASQYVYNARRRPNQYGVTFGKEHRESPRKVDWTTGAMLAFRARQDYLALPENRRRKVASGRAMFVR